MNHRISRLLLISFIAGLWAPAGSLRAFTTQDASEFGQKITLMAAASGETSGESIGAVRIRALFCAQVFEAICTQLNIVEKHLAYWQQAQQHSYRYALSRLPHRWFSGPSYRAEIREALFALTHVRDRLAKTLGQLQCLVNELLKINKIDDLRRLTPDYLAHIARMLDATGTAGEMTPEQLLVRFKKRVTKRIAPFAPANHFSRHWIEYTTSAACVAGAAYVYLKDPEGWQTLATDNANRTREGTTKFWQDHLETPAQAIYNHFLGKHQSDDINVIRSDVANKTLHESYDAVIVSQPEIAVKACDDSALRSIIQAGQLDRLALEEKNALLNRMFNELTASAAWSNAFNVTQLAKIVAVKLQEGLHALNGGKIFSQEILKENRVNFYLIPMIPAAGVCWLSYHGITRAWRFVWPQHVVYQDILAALDNFEELCNRYDNTTIALDDIGRGLLAFRVQQLKQAADRSLSGETHAALMAHARELEDPTFRCYQKLRIVDIMRRRYNFLHA